MNSDKRRPRILIGDQIHAAGIALLQEFADVDVKTGLSPDDLCALIPAYDGLIVRSATKVTADVIRHGHEV
ncbi:MAG: hypothetical protein HC804_09155 [Anaerolineae bacterium]|nr:hypothetical protein [Anaerolineae bacterium]